jgi:hypothetical protein
MAEVRPLTEEDLVRLERTMDSYLGEISADDVARLLTEVRRLRAGLRLAIERPFPSATDYVVFAQDLLEGK